MAPDPTPEEIAEAKVQGQSEAEQAQQNAPGHPLLRLAWAQGFDQEDQVRAAVELARSAGYSWAKIGAVLGIHRSTAQARFGSNYRTQYRYRQRSQGAEPPDATPGQ